MTTIKISSWNVAGLRACTRKNTFQQYLTRANPDILCLTETKCLQNQIGLPLAGYKVIWSDCKSKKGYAGVGILTKFAPIKIDLVPFDKELADGRIIVLEFKTFYLINTYVPNAGEALKFMQRKEKWNDKMRELINKLNTHKPLIWAGDLNTAYLAYDVYDGETNKNRSKSAGFTDYEREHFEKYFTEFGFIDAYRLFYPNEREKAMTYWSYLSNRRAANRGWRLDYFIASPALKSALKDVAVVSDQMGSDHAPIELTFEANEEFERVKGGNGEENGVGEGKNKSSVRQVSIKAMVRGKESGVRKTGGGIGKKKMWEHPPELNFSNDWNDFLNTEFAKTYFKTLSNHINNDLKTGSTVFPDRSDTFQAFKLTPLKTLKVVILGQDPYHGAGQAHGLCFSAQNGVMPPPSLINIAKEIYSDVGLRIAKGRGCLSGWAEQGVLLLNSVLTVAVFFEATKR